MKAIIPKGNVQPFFTKGTQRCIQYLYEPAQPQRPTLCFIPGFQSDFITSKKSNLVYDLCARHHWGFLAWNHSALDSNTSIVDWYRDGIELLKEFHIDYIVCASMGLWISLLISSEIKNTIRGVLSIGGAIDFTEKWYAEIPDTDKDIIEVYRRPSMYDSSGYYNIPMHFIKDSEKACLMRPGECINYDKTIPIHMIHGAKDADYAIEDAWLIHNFLLKNQQKEVSFHELKGGDHRLSDPFELHFIEEKIIEMVDSSP